MREAAVGHRTGDREVGRRALKRDRRLLEKAVVVAAAHKDDRLGSSGPGAAPGREAEGRTEHECEERASHGHVVGFAAPFVTFAEIVLHQAPPLPTRWKTLL